MGEPSATATTSIQRTSNCRRRTTITKFARTLLRFSPSAAGLDIVVSNVHTTDCSVRAADPLRARRAAIVFPAGFSCGHPAYGLE
jgi:hypothetical protein